MWEELKQFLSDILPDGTKFEFTAIKDWFVKVISEQEAINSKNANIYFCWWVRKDFIHKDWNRVKDLDIVNKRYFAIDIDLRNNYLELWEEITNEEIMQEWLNIAEELKTIDYFDDWSYIIYTWNWFHIYYIWDDIQIDYKDYALAVKRIFRKFDTLFWEQYRCDHACSNIARILRLPWSINQKNMAEVKIIAKQDNKKSKLFNQLQLLADAEKEEHNIKHLESKKKIEEALSKYKDWWNELYELINTQIPAWQIAQLLVPQFPFNWRKNFKNEKWWFCWYYYVADSNSICNWWSRYFNWWDENSCWSNFELIKRSKNFTNAETFAFYKDLLKLNQK